MIFQSKDISQIQFLKQSIQMKAQEQQILENGPFNPQRTHDQQIHEENQNMKEKKQEILPSCLNQKKNKEQPWTLKNSSAQCSKEEKQLKLKKFQLIEKNVQNDYCDRDQINQRYDITKYGFLQQENCSQLPQKFKFFNEIFLYLTKDKSRSFGQLVKELPAYCPEKHSLDQLSLQQQKFMFGLLACSLHSYIWENGLDNPRKTVPQIIGIPLLEISKVLGIFPSVSYAAILLYNWFPKTDTESMNPDDLSIMFNMSGTLSEEWFYLITISIEGLGGKYLTEIFNAHLLSQAKMIQFLQNMHKCIIQMKMVIKRMHEHNDPKIFYFVIRKFFTGMNHENIGPDGIQIEGTQLRIKGYGGSGSQSTLIQVLNTLFQVKLQGHAGEYLRKMIQYMPGKHVQFLYDLGKKPKIRQVIRGWRNQSIQKLYNQCIQALTQFRQAHFGLIHAYVFAFSNKNPDEQVGTGGTDLGPFLKSVIDNTKKAKIQMVQEEGNLKKVKLDSKKVKNCHGKKEILSISLVVVLACLLALAIYNRFNMI